jgi:serine/threonine-protein kinase
VARFASVRALAQAIEAFLDGQRDLELRRQMAKTHAHAAAARLGGALSTAERRAALREVGRALALDPENRDAARAMARLLAEPPVDEPPEIGEHIVAREAAHRRLSLRTGALTYAPLVLYVPLLLWLGVRQWSVVGGFFALVGAAVAISLVASRRERPGVGWVYALLAVTDGAFALVARMFGPFTVVPLMIAVNTYAACVHLDRRRRWAATAIGALAVTAPVALEWLGALAPSYRFANGEMALLPHALELPAAPTQLLLATISAVVVVVGPITIGRIWEGLLATERRLALQTWQLAQLVPDEARASPDEG